MEKDLNNLTKEELILKIKQLQKEKKLNNKYGLVWDSEKEPEQVVEQCKKEFPILKNVKSKDIKTDDSEDNILIEGDNYHALQVLNYTHKNKIDVIYIDPPYNTGNKDFLYNDKFVDREDGYRHSKWLNFMSKRLVLAKNLLTDKGVIFISIDNNEQANLKLLCDEIFGENNLLGMISVINNFKGRSDDKFFATANEFLLVYSRNKNIAKINGFELEDTELDKYTEEDSISIYKPVDLRKTGKGWKRSDRPYMFYPILYKNNKFSLPMEEEINKIYIKNLKKFDDIFLDKLKDKYEKEGFIFILPKDKKNNYGRWRWQIKTLIKNINLNNVLVKKTSDYKIFEKMRPQLGDIMRDITPKTIFYKAEYDTGSAGELLKNIFSNNPFDNPKSLYFLMDVFKISTNKESKILDFFAGSGTTGHAILELNKEDGGNRKYILCTNNENNICTDVCYPRIKKVIKGYKKNGNGEFIEGFGSNLKYFKTDFVENSKNITQSKINISKNCAEMLCIKTGIFNELENNQSYKIFCNNTHTEYLCIFYDFYNDNMKKFISSIKKLKGTKHLFLFSLDLNIEQDLFEDIPNTFIEPIPQKILDIYKKLSK